MLTLRRPLTAPRAHLLVRRSEGLPRRDRRPRRALLAATGVHSGRLQRQITAHSSTSVLGWENDPRRTRDQSLGLQSLRMSVLAKGDQGRDTKHSEGGYSASGGRDWLGLADLVR